jgi:hypothetical protein
MEKSGFRKRFVVPLLAVLPVMICSWIIYNVAWRLENHYLHQALATVFGSLLFVSVGFGAAVVYPVAFFRGASLRERIIASSITPFVWMTKECARLYISFSFFECLYYYFNVLNLWLVCGLCVEMGIAEMLCRRSLRRRGEDVKVFTAPAIVAVAGGLFLGAMVFLLGQGETFYARYLELYRFFFNAGVGVPFPR